ncbi:sodium-dependent phosphate transporter 2-like [Ctenocephalides felis]|uniref:sodium-dependent phosphate transporter 2-like n=2 Tax=Ctenocephalides felis TaxID=7515 RepID=UPI000E6E1694|nr:sodium-dependent phosphate transporter 2-like [Ctenocephalides felis]
MIEPYEPSLLWLIIVGFLVAFGMAFGIGANDVANSFGTSVGSKVLTIRQACYLASFFEISGSVLIGYKVSDTMRKGILDLSMYEDAERELMLGCIASLGGSAICMLLATFLRLPISATHSIVGSTAGFSLVARGTRGLHWSTLSSIVASWFISPALSGAISVCIYYLIRTFILRAKDPLRNGFRSIAVFYGVTVFINVFSIVHDGPKLLHLDNIAVWISVCLALAFGLTTGILAQIFILPWQKRKIAEDSVMFTVGDSSAEPSLNNSPTTEKKLAINDNNILVPEIIESHEMLQLSKKDGSKQTDVEIGNKVSPKVKNIFASLDDMDLTITSLNYIDDNGAKNLKQNEKSQNGIAVKFDNGLTTEPLDTKVESDKLTGNLLIAPQSLMVNNMSATSKDMRSMDSAATLNSQLSGTAPLLKHKNQVRVMTPHEDRAVSRLFSFLQVLTAVFGSFAHGGNDVSNAIGPIIAMWLIFADGNVLQKSETPLGILLFGGFGMVTGLWIWGRRVIQTIGEDLTSITPSTGFTIEIGSACTVLLASKLGLPISTTHCKVGSVVFVGWASAEKGVDWSLFRNIVFAWIVTVPLAGLLSGFIMYILQITAL